MKDPFEVGASNHWLAITADSESAYVHSEAERQNSIEAIFRGFSAPTRWRWRRMT